MSDIIPHGMEDGGENAQAEMLKEHLASSLAAPVGSATHELKTDPEVFDDVAAGNKTFEIRRDDRGFKVGDTLILRRTKYSGAEMRHGHLLIYTGETARRTVTHILRGPVYGLKDGWVIMSLNEITNP
jgi:hypothetical protein